MTSFQEPNCPVAIEVFVNGSRAMVTSFEVAVDDYRMQAMGDAGPSFVPSLSQVSFSCRGLLVGPLIISDRPSSHVRIDAVCENTEQGPLLDVKNIECNGDSSRLMQWVKGLWVPKVKPFVTNISEADQIRRDLEVVRR